MNEIIKEVKQKHNMTNLKVNKNLIRQRLKRNQPFVLNRKGGVYSPLKDIEEYFVGFIIKLARIHACINNSESLALINSLIKDSCEIKNKIVKWKETHSHVKGDGTDAILGVGYWAGFKKCWGHKLVNKKGQKYDLQRSQWTTYRNFSTMFDNIIGNLVDAGLAVPLEDPIWMDKDGNSCEPNEAFGCKVTHRILYPEDVLVADELGGNLSQKGDGNLGGEKLMCEAGTVPRQRSCTNDRHFTVLGFTNLLGEPVMCCVIIKGVNRNTAVETGLDFTKQLFEGSDIDFIRFNYGEGKFFPGGPKCEYRGKQVPCFIRWSKKGGITSEILKQILETIDHLGLVTRTEGRLPALIVDGHGSRLELPFVKYINDPNHTWVCCIGVPYGTALWQVGDAAEQNGAFNQALVRVKRDMMALRELHDLPLSLQPTDIMLLIRQAWGKSFARIESNRKAIAERGWYPFNRNLLLLPELRETMTEEEKNSEAENTIIIPEHLLTSQPQLQPQVQNHPVHEALPPAIQFNFDSGFSATCFDKLISHEERMKSHERMMKHAERGQTFKETIKKQKRIGASSVFKHLNCRIGKEVQDELEDRVKQKQMKTIEKQKQTRENWVKLNEAAHLFLSQNKSIEKWTGADFKVMLRPLQRTGEKMPSRKADLVAAWESWKFRPAPTFECDQPGQNTNFLTPVAGDDEGNDENGQESDDENSLDDDIALAGV